MECSSESFSSQISAFLGSQTIASSDNEAYFTPTAEIVGFDALGNNWSLSIQEDLFIGIPNLGLVVQLPYTQTDLQTENIISNSDSNIAYGTSVSFQTGSNSSYLFVSAPRSRQNSWQEGSVFILSEDGSTEQTTITGTTVQEQFGDRLHKCADLDGDNIEDLLIASSLFGGSLSNEENAALTGRIYVAKSEQWASFNSTVSADQFPTIEGESIGARLGHDARCIHDVDGDDRTDIIISSPFADSSTLDASGVIYVLPKDDPSIENAIFRLQGTTSNTWLGWSVATGDFDGDKHIDIAAGAPGAHNGLGSVFLWRGIDLLERQTAPSIEIRSEATKIGTKVQFGDINGDDFADLFIAEPQGTSPLHTTTGSGLTHVFLGRADESIYSGLQTLEIADFHFSIPISGATFGREIFFSDLNADGIDDVIFVHNATR